MGLFSKIFKFDNDKPTLQSPNQTAKVVSQQQPSEPKPINIYRIVVDVETTGTDYRHDEILQLAICNGDGIPVWNQLYKPQHTASWNEASHINGIYPRDVKKLLTYSETFPLFKIC